MDEPLDESISVTVEEVIDCTGGDSLPTTLDDAFDTALGVMGSGGDTSKKSYNILIRVVRN